MRMYAIVRLRGGVNTRPEIKDTLKMLRLHRVNHCVVIPENKQYLGMIQKVKDYVAWGVIDVDLIAMLLEKRGRLAGNLRLTEAFLHEKTPYRSFKELAEALQSGTASLKELGIKPIFRLHPPRKGHAGIKKTTSEGGELGFHEAIEKLIVRMR